MQINSSKFYFFPYLGCFCTYMRVKSCNFVMKFINDPFVATKIVIT